VLSISLAIESAIAIQIVLQVSLGDIGLLTDIDRRRRKRLG
jgi:hypothetical protein